MTREAYLVMRTIREISRGIRDDETGEIIGMAKNITVKGIEPGLLYFLPIYADIESARAAAERCGTYIEKIYIDEPEEDDDNT